jgi:hypothetical protein
MLALLTLLAALIQPVIAPCPQGIEAYPVTETYEDGSAVAGSFCDTGSEGPSVSFGLDAEDGLWRIDVR